MFMNGLTMMDVTSEVSSVVSSTSGTTSQLTGFQAFLANWSMPIMLVLMMVLMYFLMIRPQKKKEKETAKMRSNIQIGDEITTIGGVVGIVTALREDTVVIETGSDRSKVRFQRWAIQSNNTIHEES